MQGHTAESANVTPVLLLGFVLAWLTSLPASLQELSPSVPGDMDATTDHYGVELTPADQIADLPLREADARSKLLWRLDGSVEEATSL
jgi:hypothetical protein